MKRNVCFNNLIARFSCFTLNSHGNKQVNKQTNHKWASMGLQLEHCWECDLRFALIYVNSSGKLQFKITMLPAVRKTCSFSEFGIFIGCKLACANKRTRINTHSGHNSELANSLSAVIYISIDESFLECTQKHGASSLCSQFLHKQIQWYSAIIITVLRWFFPKFQFKLNDDTSM